MSIVHQSPVVSHASPHLMLCKPRLAGLLCAPKEVKPPRQTAYERFAAYLEGAPTRLEARVEEIDRRVDMMREAYGLPPREITITPISGRPPL